MGLKLQVYFIEFTVIGVGFGASQDKNTAYARVDIIVAQNRSRFVQWQWNVRFTACSFNGCNFCGILLGYSQFLV